MAITIYAYVVARSDAVEEVEEACRSIVNDCLREDGILAYHLLRDVDDARVFAWFEQWRDDDAFQRHISSPHARRLGAALEGRLEGEMVIKRYESLA